MSNRPQSGRYKRNDKESGNNEYRHEYKSKDVKSEGSGHSSSGRGGGSDSSPARGRFDKGFRGRGGGGKGTRDKEEAKGAQSKRRDGAVERGDDGYRGRRFENNQRNGHPRSYSAVSNSEPVTSREYVSSDRRQTGTKLIILCNLALSSFQPCIIYTAFTLQVLSCEISFGPGKCLALQDISRLFVKTVDSTAMGLCYILLGNVLMPTRP